METRLLHKETTHRVIGCFYDVYNTLGPGFPESIYRSALALELRAAGLEATTEATFEVQYCGEVVGRYRADLIVAHSVLIELTAAEAIDAEHRAQLMSYLKATPYEVGLVLNFGPRATFERRIFSNTSKGSLDWYVPRHPALPPTPDTK